ncbi:MAG: energy-coupling factor transporter transmembrane protein EcfT, partial [Clostridiales Family XIII bacterium]|nr:energy-coupling factor transporter transmembrane protein EcfT [Clostridiales Family XIII bacterium]
MIRDITIGQYYPGDTPVHRVDPRLKIVLTLIFIVMLFVTRDFLGYAIAMAALGGAIAASRVPLSFILRGL